MTSEILDLDDIEDLITGDMKLTDYALTDERERAAAEFALIPYEKWAEIGGTEIG